ncbi:MAG: CRISPR-associated helicase Cas3', partial [Verrucomicrobiae bacterium]|nr:CRISPR-associated helicase Cas3' [Verrucomicrobiae bacterium]
MIDVPTGLGKTAAVILAWLWNRVKLRSAEWPRRLVYCLPMRTLVEQTRDEVRQWIGNLVKAGVIQGESPEVYVLMGGEEAEQWDLYPEENAILIGTQDMLLSRALNRGYGMSRYRWPMHFGLLNNDCLWVLDETQLMGVGVETSAQLDGFRHLAQWLRHGPCPTWWMSATLEDSRLATVDHPVPDGGWSRLVLDQKDREAVSHRLAATKNLQKAALTIAKQTKQADLAKLVLEKHVEGQLTLIIVNRVQRAQQLFQALQKAGRKDNLALVHSRFRAPDRKVHQGMLIHGDVDRIVVATQAVEAGVDVSARVLITELAPWHSVVQRLGRCNRGGEFNRSGAEVYWLDLDFEKDADVAPYTLADLKDARAELEKLEGKSVSPEVVSSVKVMPPPVIRPVIRRKDLIDLFDTTPDIAGHDLDISRYVRDGDDTDVQVFWRDLSTQDFSPNADTEGPARDEFCRVAVYRFQAFLDKLKKANDGRKAYVWDGLREEWRPETRARAGATYLLDHRAGGYDVELGWTGEVATLKKESEWTAPLAVSSHRKEDSTQRDLLSYTGKPLSLTDHTNDVVAETKAILDALGISTKWSPPLLTAAQWHDVGKSFKEFQEMLRSAAGEDAPADVLAKSGGKGGSMPRWRKHFRHELASALAWLTHHDGTEHADLIAYVIAAHHGKVRLSIRSLPEEQPPPD